MTVTPLVPSVDLAPSVTSRVVSINAVELTEGTPAKGFVVFTLRCDLHVPADDVIIQAGSATVELINGRGEIRLPCFDPDALPGDWSILVKKSWAPYAYEIRVPMGTTAISLADITPLKVLKRKEEKYAISGVSVGVTEGSASGSGYVSGGILNLSLSYPASAYRRGALAGSDLNTLIKTTDAGLWDLAANTTYQNAPVANVDGTLIVDAAANGTTTHTIWVKGDRHRWERVRNIDGGSWSPWTQPTAKGALTALGRLAALVGYGGTATVACLTDSTGNNSWDWPRLWLTIEAQRRATKADLSITYQEYDYTNNKWGAVETVKGGTVTPASGGQLYHDDFATDTAELVGSGKYTGNTGAWSASGGYAKAVGSSKILKFNGGAVDGTFTANFEVNTKPTGGAQMMRIYFSTSLWAFINISYLGVMSGGVYTDSTLVGAIPASAFPPAGVDAWVPLSVKITKAIQQMTVQIGTGELRYVVEQAKSSAQTDGKSLMTGTADTSGIRVDSLDFATPYTPERSSGIKVMNAGYAGGTLATYDAYPNQFDGINVDILVIDEGHNYGVMDGAGFVTTVENFIAKWRLKHPESLVLMSGQNPEFDPAVNRAKHAERQMELRSWCERENISYLPVFERFARQPDGGKSWCDPDGVHPTTVGDTVVRDGKGQAEWAKVMAEQVAKWDGTV